MENSKDYSRFSIAPNKPINRSHVEKLKNEIMLNDLGVHYPIQCIEEEDSIIIHNGQHRFTARKELDLEIYYEISKITLMEERRAEKLTLKWSKSDVVYYYASLGIQSYKYLNEIEVKTGWTVSTFSKGVLSLHDRDIFESGNIQFSEEDYKLTMKVIEFTERVMLFVPFKVNKKLFIAAIRNCFEHKKIDTEKLAVNMEKYNELIVPKITVGGYLETLEKVYNYRVPAKNRVIFVTKRKQ